MGGLEGLCPSKNLILPVLCGTLRVPHKTGRKFYAGPAEPPGTPTSHDRLAAIGNAD
jgi:hypothetical protein